MGRADGFRNPALTPRMPPEPGLSRMKFGKPVFVSSLTREQIIVALIGALLLVLGGYVMFEAGRLLDPPLRDVATEIGLWGRYQAGFMRGIFNLKDVVYYLAMIYFFLLLSVKTLEAKRWQ